MDLPFILGYKPHGNSQLLLRKAVQKFILDRAHLVRNVVDGLEEVKVPAERQFRGVLVDAPAIELVVQIQSKAPRVRLPRKIDFAARDEANRQLGRTGEPWVLGFEQQRLQDISRAELFRGWTGYQTVLVMAPAMTYCPTMPRTNRATLRSRRLTALTRLRSSPAATNSNSRRRMEMRFIFTAYFNFVRPQCSTCCTATFRSSRT